MAESKKKTVEVETKYPREEIFHNAQVLFSVKPEVIAGALHGHKQGEFTVAEVKKFIGIFLKRRVS